MSFLSNIAHVVAQPVGAAASWLGHTTGNNQLSQFGSNVSNPNVHLSNPGGLFQNNNPAFTGAGAYGATAPPAAAPMTQGNPQVLGASTDIANSGANGSGGSNASTSTTGNGGGTNNPQYQGFQNYLGQLTNAYHGLFGTGGLYDQQTASRENSDMKNYGAQKDALNQQYGDTMEYMPGQYGARGLGSSSYYNNAMDSAKNTYGSNMEQLGNAEQNDLVALQQAAGSAKNQGNAQLQAYQKLAEGGPHSTLAQMPTYLQAEQYGNILNANTAAQGELGSTGSNESFLSHIPAPVQNQGTAQLQAQLQALANSPTTSAAKSQIASGLIGSSQLPQNQQTALNGYWNQVSNS